MKVMSGREVTVAIISLTNAKDLYLECARVVNENLVVPVSLNGIETTVWREKSRSWISFVP